MKQLKGVNMGNKYFIFPVDTNIIFKKKEYYIKFKDKYKIKYISGYAGKEEDNLILQTKKEDRIDIEKAWMIVTELLSALSFSWNRPFDTHNCFIEQASDFTEIRSMCGSKKIFSFNYESRDDFVCIHPLDEEHVMLARLFRIAKTSNSIYTEILFLWHCLCWSGKGEAQADSQTADEINEYSKKDIYCEDIKNVLRDGFLMKKPRSIKSFGDYILTCIRHSTAHIERNPGAQGKNLTIDSHKELVHLNLVRKILEKMTIYKMKEKHGINKKDDPKYLSYIL